MARILVIDDDPDILAIAEHALSEAGHEVIASSEPGETAALARDHNVDAVILDVMMPGISGFDALRTLRGEPGTGGVPILFLSSRGESGDRVRGLREGADDYMTKPFDLEELVLRVERLVGPRARPATAVASPDLARTLKEGRVVGQVFLGRYQALELIGQGAVGTVFRGWDPRLKRPVALKTLRIELLMDTEDRAQKISQLIEEAITAARFNHPHLVSVFDADSDSEIAYLAMEYVDGPSLGQYLTRHGHLAFDQTVALALALARGLAAAHEHHIVHHDVKPANVLLGRDLSIKLSDFGVAHLVQALSERADKVFGTIGYLPPEALQGRGYDERGDLFALGAVLYECLTGERAFGGETIHIRLYRTVEIEVVPPHVHMPDIPVALDDLILDLLEKDPARRVGSATELVARLEALYDREPAWTPSLDASVENTMPEAHSKLHALKDLTTTLKGAYQHLGAAPSLPESSGE